MTGVWIGLSFTATVGLACGHPDSSTPDAEPPPAATVELVARTPHLATFPCGESCHDDREPDETPRQLTEFHAGRQLEHGPGLHWCSDCHAIADIDHLRLFGGESISFDASHLICAQCHGPKHRDWSRGIHGLQTGGWTGTVQRRSCTACHEPHAPSKIRLQALPPPLLDPRLEDRE